MKRDQILAALADIERTENVTVLFAVESGSRAWGHASPDSDWDVRFIYARPVDWFLQVSPGRDVIERQLPGDLDLSGWDMRKTLGLLLRGNCTLREWIRSPIVYVDGTGIMRDVRALAASIPARRAALHHYRSLATIVVHRYLSAETVNLKKYLYAVRPALALRWLREHPDGYPPMDVPMLRVQVTLSSDEQGALEAILAAKAMASEVGTGRRVAVLDAMIATELELALAAAELEPVAQPGQEAIKEADSILFAAAHLAH